MGPQVSIQYGKCMLGVISTHPVLKGIFFIAREEKLVSFPSSMENHGLGEF